MDVAMLPDGTEASRPTEEEKRFQDRGVLVTGGGSGIGQQVCYAAAEEGARVAVGDLDQERAEATAAEIRRRKGEAHAFYLDVTNPDSAARFIAAAESSLARGRRSKSPHHRTPRPQSGRGRGPRPSAGARG
jgi:NAD(P)-dependent dehydrogenase (short-subunit alcohol dehydrogenase family)